MKLPPLPPALAQRAGALAVALAFAATTPSLPALAVDATLNEAELKAMGEDKAEAGGLDCEQCGLDNRRLRVGNGRIGDVGLAAPSGAGSLGFTYRAAITALSPTNGSVGGGTPLNSEISSEMTFFILFSASLRTRTCSSPSKPTSRKSHLP